MSQTVSTGLLCALALVCLVQYVVHLFHLARARRVATLVRRELDELETELAVVQRERLMTRLENDVLREFVSQSGIYEAVDALLTRLVPRIRTDFAAYFRWQHGVVDLYRSRGLVEASRQRIRVDRDLADRVLRERAVVLEGEDLVRSSLLGSLARQDRGKVREMFALLVGDRDDPVGVLVTTALYPTAAPRSQQLELARRLMQSIAGNIRWAQVLETRENELKSSNEMLSLRSISDGRYDTPLEMIEHFLDRLRQFTGAERIVLYLSATDSRNSRKPLTRRGLEYRRGLEQRWQEHEDRLAEIGAVGGRETRVLASGDLKRLGVMTLVERAIVAPLVRGRSTIGVVCLTTRAAGRFDEAHVRLVQWAAGHLSDTVDRALQQALVEKRAREDGLTELANRREFDERLAEHVRTSVKHATEAGLLLIDLDHFKLVNDDYGHRTGDEVLRVLARVVRESVGRIRSGDRALVARYGGEEVAVLLPGASADATERIAEDVRRAIEDTTVEFEERSVRVTASIGFAVCPLHATDADGMIAAADAALYRAKERGRNRVVAAAEGALV